jgi:hypothetical protein
MMSGWKQRVTKFPGNADGIFERFEELFLRAGAPMEMALLSRTSNDFEHEIYLLSPAASRVAEVIGGEWTDCNPFDNKWTVCIANGNVEETFGISIGQEGG